MEQKEETLQLSNQALGAIMMALQESLLNELDIVPILKGFELTQTDDGLVVNNPPTVRVTNNQEVTNKDLEKQIKYFKSDTFKEIEARAKLGYQKPEEKVIILPKDQQSAGDSDNIDSLSDIRNNKKPPDPNYLDWWQIFFGS